MVETTGTPENSKIESANLRFSSALEAVFGVAGPEGNDVLVNYDFDGNEKNKQLAELAVIELFKAGFEIEKIEKDEKLKALKEFSEEARLLQKPGSKEIAYDYVVGGRTREDSQRIAQQVYAEYANRAYDDWHKFIKMKTDQIDWERTDNRKEKDELTQLNINSGKQMKKAQIFIKERYGLGAPMEEFRKTNSESPIQQSITQSSNA